MKMNKKEKYAKENVKSNSTIHKIISADGENASLIRNFDWSKTPIGPIGQWPQSLTSTIKTILGSRYPMILLWGDELLQFYNDAYTGLIGDKHPYAIGRSIKKTQAESWPVIGPMIEKVMTTGIPNWVPAQMLPLNRAGYREESYFSLSYSAVEDDEGEIKGMLCVCSEVTQQVITERRLRLQRDLGAKAGDIRNVELACKDIIKTIAEYSWDVPFALLYLRDKNSNTFIACGDVGIKNAKVTFPALIDIDNTPRKNDIWHFARVAAGETVLIKNLEKIIKLPSEPFSDSVTSALVMPITSIRPESPLGILITGISPNRALDEGYRSFYELLSGQVSAAIRNAQAYEQERQRAEALAELDRAKTTFFSNISHEFRTPLTLILGPLEDALSDKDNKLPQKQYERIEVIQRNSLRLQRLVNALLDFSRIEAGRIQAKYQPTDIGQYTAELASAFQSAMEKANLKFTVNCPSLSKSVYVDRDMWEKIVLNLLSNALKFTFKGEIKILLVEEKGKAVLKVSDTGEGIPKSELKNLFKRFYRVQGAKSRTHEGSGIGLALVEELVKLHGGTIHVESTQNRGTTFTIQIPFGSTHLSKDQVIDSDTTSVPSKKSSIYTDEAKQWLQDTSPQYVDESELGEDTLNTSTSSSTILIVDDNADMRNYISRILGVYPTWKIITTNNGLQALKAIKKKVPDVILTDIMMPEMDGFELVKKLRSDAKTKRIPIIFLSARAGEEAKIEGLEKGADDYLVKPFSARELLARVRTQLEMAEIRQDNALLKQAEEALKISEERFRQLADSMPQQVWTATPEGKLDYINQQTIHYFKISKEKIIGDGWQDLVHPDELPQVIQKWKSSLSTGNVYEVEFRLQKGRNKEYRWHLGRALPITDNNGSVTKWYGTNTDIDERKKLEAHKDEFIGIASHELKTPVTSIKAYTQLLDLRFQKAEDIQSSELVQKMDGQLNKLTTLINDLLDVTKIESGRILFQTGYFDINELIEEITGEMQLTTSKHTIHKKLGKAISLFGDRDRIGQVLTNFISNAIKYSPQADKIIIKSTLSTDKFIISVQDFGVGIPESMKEKVFERFYRVEREKQDTFAGLGLGLYISSEIVKRHNGQVWVESEEGKGSTFYFSLPLKKTSIKQQHEILTENGLR
jgi:PAS domain S-box-containing protein